MFNIIIIIIIQTRHKKSDLYPQKTIELELFRLHSEKKYIIIQIK